MQTQFGQDLFLMSFLKPKDTCDDEPMKLAKTESVYNNEPSDTRT